MQENEGMSIRVAAIIATLPYSIAKRRYHQWNKLCENGEGLPRSSKNTGAKSKLTDKHTVFIFEKSMNNQQLVAMTSLISFVAISKI